MNFLVRFFNLIISIRKNCDIREMPSIYEKIVSKYLISLCHSRIENIAKRAFIAMKFDVVPKI